MHHEASPSDDPHSTAPPSVAVQHPQLTRDTPTRGCRQRRRAAASASSRVTTKQVAHTFGLAFRDHVGDRVMDWSIDETNSRCARTNHGGRCVTLLFVEVPSYAALADAAAKTLTIVLGPVAVVPGLHLASSDRAVVLRAVATDRAGRVYPLVLKAPVGSGLSSAAGRGRLATASRGARTGRGSAARNLS